MGVGSGCGSTRQEDYTCGHQRRSAEHQETLSYPDVDGVRRLFHLRHVPNSADPHLVPREPELRSCFAKGDELIA